MGSAEKNDWDIVDDDDAVESLVDLLGFKPTCDRNPAEKCGCLKLMQHPQLFRSKEGMCNSDLFFPWACPYSCKAFEPYGPKNVTVMMAEVEEKAFKEQFQMTYATLQL